jgi:hypothetical protein
MAAFPTSGILKLSINRYISQGALRKSLFASCAISGCTLRISTQPVGNRCENQPGDRADYCAPRKASVSSFSRLVAHDFLLVKRLFDVLQLESLVARRIIEHPFAKGFAISFEKHSTSAELGGANRHIAGLLIQKRLGAQSVKFFCLLGADPHTFSLTWQRVRLLGSLERFNFVSGFLYLFFSNRLTKAIALAVCRNACGMSNQLQGEENNARAVLSTKLVQTERVTFAVHQGRIRQAEVGGHRHPVPVSGIAGKRWICSVSL